MNVGEYRMEVVLVFLLYLLFNPVTLIVIVLFLYRNEQFKTDTYYKVTNIGYFKVRSDVGRYGEYLIYKYLKKYEQFGAKFLFNLYIPKNNDETTEIDVLMISSKGLFVFESKNYSGWIFGSDNQRYWYQTLPVGRRRSLKERFYNPIFQNNTHVKCLKPLIEAGLPIYSIIAFSDRCTLKKININNKNVHVVNRYQVPRVVSSIYDEQDDVLSDEEIDEIYDKLYPYSQVDYVVKMKHIDDINRRIEGDYDDDVVLDDEEISPLENEITDNEEYAGGESVEHNDTIDDETLESTSDSVETDDTLICPVCGAKLVLRTARYGEHAGEEFYGCSNYPKCNYIKKK